MRLALVLVMLLVAVSPVLAGGRAMTIDDLLAVKGVSDPQLSPDGKLVLYSVGTIDREANRGRSDLWLVPVEGGEPKQLTFAPGNDSEGRWSPDGQTIAFVSDRGGSPQVWLLPLSGGEARPLTKLPVGVSGPIWSPTGQQIAFVAEVYPDTSPDDTAKRDKEREESKSQARVYDGLMIRHWTSWDEVKRSHLFVCDVATGACRDLTPGLKVNVPPGPFGGSSDYTFSPDGSELAFTAEPAVDHAWSTNTDIWTVPVAGGELRNRTIKNKAADGSPAYAPDGKTLAYVRQVRPGFEADLGVLTLLALDQENAEPVEVTRLADRPVAGFRWAKDGSGFWATIDDGGAEPIVWIDARGQNRPDGKTLTGDDIAKRVVKGGVNTAAEATADGKSLVYIHHDAAHPAEVFRSGIDGSNPVALTKHNADLVASLDLSPAEGFTFQGADGDTVSGWIVKPPGFDASKKYPVLFLIHGGPQGAWHDEWHGRWNYPLFAAPGYVVVAVNPRGSTGYGQTFTDQISADWSGRVFEDLMKGLDFALEKYPYLDRERMAAAGGSYGGYMVNWLCGHTDRFKALISHAGVFDLVSMYGTTEELWFADWEFGGPYWEKMELYRELSPSSYAERFKTPTLVIHGQLDFRVDVGQGFGMFTALQRQGVPSRLVYFPDEGHWILKPANRVVWWNEMHAWLAKYLMK
jgi:dipeptidyl aminopeptidase/acylaminoacyl peptidase